MKGAPKTFLLIAGLLLVVGALGIFAFGAFFSFIYTVDQSSFEDNSGRYTAALKIVSNSNGARPTPTPDTTSTNTNGAFILPTPKPTPIRTPEPPPTPTPSPTPTLVPTPSPPLRMGDGCKFTSGPRAGQIQDNSNLPPTPLGSTCTDGHGSTGIVVEWHMPTPTPTSPPTPRRSPSPIRTPEPTPPAPLSFSAASAAENLPPGDDADDYSFSYASTQQQPPPPATAATPTAEKDNVDMCYPVSMYTGEGKSVILRLIRALEPVIDDFCPTSPDKKRDVKDALALSTDNTSSAKTNKLLKDFCLSKGADYEPQVFAKLNSSSFKVDTDPSRQMQSLREPLQEWDFSIRPEEGVVGQQEVSFSLRVDCVNKRDKADVQPFPLPASPSFKVDVQKKPSPPWEFGTINIAGLLSGLIGSVFCVPFLSGWIKSWREKRAAKKKGRAGFR